MGEWIRKFVLNRLLYMVLLVVLCLGIFPFFVLFPFTMKIGQALDKFSLTSNLTPKIERVWDIIGRPYDALVSMVG